MSVTFDGVEIQNTTYMPQFVKHETAPERDIISLSLARADGDVFLSTRYGRKTIRIRGTLRGATQEDLEDAVDEFKELFSRQEKSLDISWNNTTRRYVATCTHHEFDRDHYHLSAVPWSAEFTVSSGIGTDTETTEPVDEESISTSEQSDGSCIYEGNFAMAGSKPAGPLITLVFGTVDADMKGVEFLNTDNGDRIIITRNGDWSDKTVIIDCENRRVLDNVLADGDPIEGVFYGQFPRFVIGTNNYRITTGGLVNQTSDEESVPSPSAASFVNFNDDDLNFAIGFRVPYRDETFGGIVVGVSQVGTPINNLRFHIYAGDTDPDGSPLVETIIVPDTPPTHPSFAYLTLFDTLLTLEANTIYWLQGSIAGDETGDSYEWNADPSIGYPRGGAVVSSDGGSSWTPSTYIPAFKILFGGAPKETDITLSIAYTKAFL